jgi:glycosyltransferase involved in cell wall biosynthesis
MKILFLSLLSYPFGGAESFTNEAFLWLIEKGHQCIWVSFKNSKTGKYLIENIESKENCTYHHYVGGMTSSNISNVIKIYSPDIIHLIPEAEPSHFVELEKSDIPVVIGYHFWNALLTNAQIAIDIMGNSSIRIDPIYYGICDNPLFEKYVVSDFMNDCLSHVGGDKINNIIYSYNQNSICKLLPFKKRKYVSIINIHPYKGGQIFLDIIQNLDLPYIAVSTNPTPLDQTIQNVLSKNKDNLFLTYTDIREIYSKSRIVIIPTQLDETFCRVAYEASNNGVLVICSGKGFLSRMFENDGIYCRDSSEYIQAIKKYYFSQSENESKSKSMKDKVLRFKNNKEQFINLIEKHSLLHRNRNVMIFCPWGEQGLGIQSRVYSKILRDNGYCVHIFSYKSYFTKHLINQYISNEWLEYDSIYYSYNTREEITQSELYNFVSEKRIGKCIIPEICGGFDKFDYIKKYGVKFYAIPNIEIVKKSDLERLSIFDKILCPTKCCYDILFSYNVKNLEYIGHSFKKISDNCSSSLKFLHISGYNAITRKNTLLLIESFKEALRFRNDIQLIITVSSICKRLVNEINYLPPQISIKCQKLSHQEILELYQNNDLSIQISTHEGLGLGFYESLSCCCPVLTINCPPHNEVINSNNGWILPCHPFTLTDNKEAIVSGYNVNKKSLVDFFKQVSCSQIEEKKNFIKNSPSNYESFVDRLNKSIL